MKPYVAILVLAIGCYDRPAAHPLPVNDDPTGLDMSYDNVCRHLNELGCSEGADSNCPRVLDKLERISIMPKACWLHAATAGAAQKCGVPICQ